MSKITVIVQWYLVLPCQFPWAQFSAEVRLLTNAGGLKWICSLRSVEQDLASPLQPGC